jgi:hypothetical protein
MEKVKILYKPEVEDFFFDLVLLLFREDYFSYLEMLNRIKIISLIL